MSNGTDIAAEIAAALREVGEATGEGPLVVTLIKPGVNGGPEWDPQPGPPTEHPIIVMDENSMRRDITGTIIGEAAHVLTVSTEGGIAPAMEDTIRMPDGRTLGITEVAAFAPGGVVLFYEVKVSG